MTTLPSVMSPAAQHAEAVYLLEDRLGMHFRIEFDIMFLVLMARNNDLAGSVTCPYCRAEPGELCDPEDSRLGAPEDYGHLHRERWEEACPDYLDLLQQGLDWIINDDRADRVLYDYCYDYDPSDAPANVRESMLILLRGLE